MKQLFFLLFILVMAIWLIKLFAVHTAAIHWLLVPAIVFGFLGLRIDDEEIGI